MIGYKESVENAKMGGEEVEHKPNLNVQLFENNFYSATQKGYLW